MAPVVSVVPCSVVATRPHPTGDISDQVVQRTRHVVERTFGEMELIARIRLVPGVKTFRKGVADPMSQDFFVTYLPDRSGQLTAIPHGHLSRFAEGA